MLSHYTSVAIEQAPLHDERELFIASNVQSLEDFLKTELSSGRHIYCSFSQSKLDLCISKLLIRRRIKSISFYDGQTLLLIDTLSASVT